MERNRYRNRIAEITPLVGDNDEDSFPIDDLPPDDLPVRDVTEDQLERPQTHSVIIKVAGKLARELPVAAPAPRPDNLDPPRDAVLHNEPVTETSAPDPKLRAEVAEPQTQYLLPDLVSADPVEARHRGGGRKHEPRSHRRGGAASKSALKAAQFELWLDDNHVDETGPR